MKQILFAGLLQFTFSTSIAQNTGIGTSTPNSTLEVAGSTANRAIIASGNITLGNFSTLICNQPTTVNVPVPSADNYNRIYRLVPRGSGQTIQLTGSPVLGYNNVQISILSAGDPISIQSTAQGWLRID